MKAALISFAKRLWPDFDQLASTDRFRLLVNLSGLIFYLPWLLIGLVWLGMVLDLSVLSADWEMLVFILAFSVILERLPYFVFFDLGGENYSYNGGTLSDILLLSAVFIFGPSAVLLSVISKLLEYAITWSPKASRTQRMVWVRNLTFNVGVQTVALLTGLAIYAGAGGEYPLSGTSEAEILWALMAVVVYWAIVLLLMLVWWFFLYQLGLLEAQRADLPKERRAVGLYWQSLIFSTLAYFPGIFGIFAAVLFTRIGLWAYLFLVLAVVLVNWLSRRLSLAVLVSQQKTRELDHLEQLGRAIITAPADASNLSELLGQYVPAMLPYKQLQILLFDGHELLNIPEGGPGLPSVLWDYFKKYPGHLEFQQGDKLPWSQESTSDRYVLAPILAVESGKPIGGICLVQDRIIFMDVATDVRPALQVLGAQIASALQAAAAFRQTLEHQKVTQELALAGEIQASLLAHEAQEIEGWRIAVLLESAKETSGDFFDLIPLPGERLGVLIADVADKGIGAALFMAFSRTLIRTYAYEYPEAPERVLEATNRRIFSDQGARRGNSDLFVTTFYAVLNTASGEFTYANAGHNPPYWLRPGMDAPVLTLKTTGMALGVIEQETWENRRLQIEDGDTLLLYTDGITEAQNPVGAFYGDKRLLKIALSMVEHTPGELRDAALQDVRRFVGEAPQSDDITLLVLKRSAEVLNSTSQPKSSID